MLHRVENAHDIFCILSFSSSPDAVCRSQTLRSMEMIRTKTSREGWFPQSSSYIEKPTGGKRIGTRRVVCYDILATQVNIH